MVMCIGVKDAAEIEWFAFLLEKPKQWRTTAAPTDITKRAAFSKVMY